MDTNHSASFKKQVLRATLWMTTLTFLGQVLTWAATIIVIRLLQPQDYGLLAMATVFLGFLTTLSELGLGGAVIQQREISHYQGRQAAGFVLLLNLFLVVLLFLGAPLVSAYFNEERLTLVIRILSVNFILMSFYNIPRAMMMRNLDFRRKSMIELLANLTNSGVVLVLALNEFGVWALVSGMISGQAFKAVMFNVFSPVRYLPSFSFEGIRPMLYFGAHMTITSILWYFYSQSDVLIGGRVLGKELIGIYAVSMQLITLPLSKITPLVSQIGFSASSRIQTEVGVIQTNFIKLARLVNTISFPLFVGFALVATEAVPVLLGPKWRPAIVPMQILALVMPLRFITALFPPIVNGLGHPRVNTGNMIYAVMIMPPAFFIGSNWGIIGFCMTWLIAFPVLFFIICSRSLRVMRLPLLNLLKTIAVPLAGSLIMATIVIGLKILLNHRFPRPALLVLLIAGGAVVYTVAVFACNRNILKEIKNFAFAR